MCKPEPRRLKIVRPVKDMVARLHDHCELLRDYNNKALEGHEHYWGEVAGKLRLLAIKTNANKPLLRKVATRFNATTKTTSTRAPYESTLTEILRRKVYDLPMRDGTREIVSARDLILMLCEQTGAAHEEWSFDERLHHIIDLGTYLPELPQKVYHHILHEASRQVLRVADNVFAHIAQMAPDNLPTNHPLSRSP